MRYLCANTHPDHATIGEFRTENEAAFKAALVRVLELAHELKLRAVGTVSGDGTKVAANASKHAAVSYARAGELLAQLELEVEQLMAQAQAAELARRQSRKAALERARAVIAERARERAQAGAGGVRVQAAGTPGTGGAGAQTQWAQTGAAVFGAPADGPVQLHGSGESDHEGRIGSPLRAGV